ncbi:(Fe-S)-binding protein [Brachyspira aalborgi]|uniref:(Fe-S)-binding protein n=1 Tax=Brachyspira aalborgi TaxID=29522 RepID=A0A5C8GGQ2_9SPIR|nr:(Fe-S)-binding protein [Brachyspira aalborgi]
MQMPNNVNDCIHCNKCVKKCDFLTKYNMDLHEFSKRDDLAYNCFLCNDCKIVCPKDIDGSKISLALRNSWKDKNYIEKKYKALLFEKKNYIFKNYKHSNTKSILFPGCNFSSFYPNAVKKIADIFRKEYNIGIAFDCCGKPIAELEIKDYEENIIKEIEKSMELSKVEEIITLCPNCYYFLKPRISIKIVTIYEKIFELGIKISNVDFPKEINLFLPCPDKESKFIKESILKLIPQYKDNIKEINDINCCGLGGCAIVNERDIAKGFIEKLKSKNLNNLYVYCATCAGNFNRNKINNVRHLLLDFLNIKENISDKTSLLNRAKFKFY